MILTGGTLTGEVDRSRLALSEQLRTGATRAGGDESKRSCAGAGGLRLWWAMCWTLSIDPSRGTSRNLDIQFGHHHSGVVVAVPRWSSVTALSSRIQTINFAMTALETGPMRTNFLLVSLMPTKTCSRNRQAPFITKHKNDRSAKRGNALEQIEPLPVSHLAYSFMATRQCNFYMKISRKRGPLPPPDWFPRYSLPLH